MLSPPEQHHHQNPLTHLLENISSYDGNVMLAAVISLLLVILFVLLLHIYAKWFLQRAQHRRRRRRRRRISSRRSGDPSMSNVLRPGRFHHFQNFPFDNNINSQGLEPSTIASIPLFVYSPNNDNVNNGNDDDGGHDIECLECVVCLSVFEDSDVCRCLPKCGHSFHVECIDMWLHSHTNCPICRAPVVPEKTVAMEVHDHPLFFTDNNDDNSVETGAELVEIVVVDQQARESNCEINEHDQIQDVGFLKHDSSSSSPSSSGSSSSSSLGSSLKRMLSRNSRSDHQTKAFPSTDNSNNTNLELGD